MAERYEYRVINVSLEPVNIDNGRSTRQTVETAANRWAAMGWRTVGVMPASRTGTSDCIIVERKIEKAEKKEKKKEVDIEGEDYLV